MALQRPRLPAPLPLRVHRLGPEMPATATPSIPICLPSERRLNVLGKPQGLPLSGYSSEEEGPGDSPFGAVRDLGTVARRVAVSLACAFGPFTTWCTARQVSQMRSN